ncbi:SPT2 chromatin protein [Striga asiatica]|uniref:SPT2 chromatin protein n=1 Tax=Striga asiatica TaxID=4170 RepID=A0A5A7Q908_STRAF|nr:SPT2 chromatin protein [Striga asiatica]
MATWASKQTVAGQAPMGSPGSGRTTVDGASVKGTGEVDGAGDGEAGYLERDGDVPIAVGSATGLDEDSGGAGVIQRRLVPGSPIWKQTVATDSPIPAQDMSKEPSFKPILHSEYGV